MLKVQTSDGRTHKVDLRDKETAREWMRRLLDPAFQAKISAISISQNGSQYTMTRPQDYRDEDIHFDLAQINPTAKWKGGEEVIGFFGDVRVSMLVHNSQRAARVNVTKTGKRVHIPVTR